MFVDCATCPVRGRSCDDCIVPVLLDAQPGMPLDEEERRAVDVFVGAGLVDVREAVRLRAVSEPWLGARVG